MDEVFSLDLIEGVRLILEGLDKRVIVRDLNQTNGTCTVDFVLLVAAAHVCLSVVVELIEHGPIGFLLINVSIVWKTLHVLIPSNLVSETPRYEGLAV